jgi:hypothetical protein
MSFIQVSLESVERRGSVHGHFDAVIFSARALHYFLCARNDCLDRAEVNFESAELGFETEPDIIRVPSTV